MKIKTNLKVFCLCMFHFQQRFVKLESSRYKKINKALISIMSKKRSLDASTNGEGSAKKIAKTGHWSMGLLASIDDPKCIVEKDELVTVIKDKYPKAEHHYLVIPHENISSLKALSKNHLDLVRHIDKIGEELTTRDEHKGKHFKLGYHSEASMFRLHLHVISDDMNSPCLKTKKHWNSFTTEFFLDSKAVVKELEENGKVQLFSKEKCKALMDTPLKCHKCDFIPKNMPDLKKHILKHL